MISMSSLLSARLRAALIVKAEILLDTMDTFHYNNPRRVVQFLRHIKCIHRPLLEKCSRIFLKNVPNLDVENLSIIVTLYQSLSFSNWDFRQAAIQRLVELMHSCTDPESFTKLFIALGPLAGPTTRERYKQKKWTRTCFRVNLYNTIHLIRWFYSCKSWFLTFL